MKSNTNVAQDAVSQFRGIDLFNFKNKNLTIGKNTSTGVKNCTNLYNHIGEDLKELASSIQKQAKKFPDLAQIIAKRDHSDQNFFKGGK